MALVVTGETTYMFDMLKRENASPVCLQYDGCLSMEDRKSTLYFQPLIPFLSSMIFAFQNCRRHIIQIDGGRVLPVRIYETKDYTLLIICIPIKHPPI